MHLLVLPLRLTDFDAIIAQTTTSTPGDDLVGAPNPWLWPVVTPEEASVRIAFCMSLQRKRFLEDSTCHFVKVVDRPSDATSEDDGEIISLARWHRYSDGFSYEEHGHWELAAPHAKSYMGGVPPTFNMQLHDLIFTERDPYREQWIPKGKPAWILMHLVTRPSQRGRGAASMLIEWGQAKAAADGAAAYLEAGAAARPLYEKHGFQFCEQRLIDMKAQGANIDFIFDITNMSWHPQRKEVGIESAAMKS